MQKEHVLFYPSSSPHFHWQLTQYQDENEEIDTDTILLTELQALLQGC